MNDEPTPSPDIREFARDDKQLPEFVAWVKAVDEDAWLYYLCESGLNEHLARFVAGSPFDRGTHASRRMAVLIAQFLRQDSDRMLEFGWALQGYIRDHALIQEHFPYHAPEGLATPQK